MTIANFDIEVPRNGSWHRQLSVVADETGDAIDLTGASIDMFVRNRAGDPGVPLAEAHITVIDVLGGIFEASFLGDDFAAVPGVHELVRLAYDLKITQGGEPNVIARGAVILSPGVTY